MSEIKYEAVFGDQSLFDGAPEDAEIVGQSASERSKRITELQDALELAGEAVRAKHVPSAGKMVPDVCHALMTLDEAIDHANEKSMGDSQCAAQHAQLAKWLTDYRAMLSAAPKLGGE